MTTTTKRRGAFVCLEGVDHSGKTTQAALLCDALRKRDIPATVIRFPDRATSTGELIDAYLRERADIDDHAIHLLYSVNRWEKMRDVRALLSAGTTLIVDRYAYSGVAYTAAKGFDLAWCKSPDRGLIKPDVVAYLSVTLAVALERGASKQRERYERLDFLTKVKEVFEKSLCEPSWEIVDASKSFD